MTCIFCRIVKGEIPCMKVFESEHTLAFLDINPLANGHTVVIPKHHCEFTHQMESCCQEDFMKALVIVSQKIAKQYGQYNILNNNGPEAGQVVKHTHFHVIPKAGAGLVMDWKPLEAKQPLEEVQKLLL
uniref:HIT domain-containing protein n=1 Tax=Trepomonas sp. PC1 TaxID=1076344 RepID=A0A146KAU4_9EUKA|eukprot:JAP93388.1 HIT domain-containing protein [Trepomonas sp. PC1]